MPLAGFSLELDEHAAERHRGILERTPERTRSTMPPGFRAEDALGVTRSRGFLPRPEAAEAMSLSEDEVVDQVFRGLLEGRLIGSTLYVQPAIVSVLAVRGGTE